jgi:hypothetical protein
LLFRETSTAMSKEESMSPSDNESQNEQVSPSNPVISDALLRLQIAEYEALMTRGNYFMSFYVGITSVIVAVVVLVLPEWLRSRDVAILWLGGAAIQIALHMYGSYVEEDYLLVSYLENNLRRAVADNMPGLGSHSFWQYEPFLARWRMHENWWSEWILPSVATIALIIGIVLRRTAFLQDLWWILLNGSLLGALLVRTYLRVRLRKTFSHRVKPSEQQTA